jgi:hypothetical protein
LFEEDFLQEYKNIKAIAAANVTRWFTFHKVLYKLVVLKLGILELLEFYEENEPAAIGYKEKLL